MSRLSIERLRAAVHYDPETGQFTRRKNGRPCLCTLDAQGYLRGSVLGCRLLAHRAAFAIVHGYWPRMVDHINRDRTDNRISNLREATHSQNVRNSDYYEQAKGVSYLRSADRWIARRNGKYLGCFPDRESAVKAARLAQSA